MSVDIIVAPQSQFDGILQDVNNVALLDVTRGADVSIDDVVTMGQAHGGRGAATTFVHLVSFRG